MPETSMKTEHKKTVATKTLSPIDDQLRNAWEIVKMSWKKLLILSIILWATILGLFLLGGGTAAGVLVGFGGPENLGAGGIGTIVGMGLLLFVAAMAIGTAYSSSMLLALNEAKENPSIGSLLSRGFKLFLPVFVTSLIVFFLAWGGIFLLVIPGIVIGVLCSFAMYEVILTENKYLSAIQNSIKIVSQNFWELFVRVLVIFGISLGWIIVSSILGAMVGDNEAAEGALGLVSGIAQMLFGWIIMAYYLIVYKEARAATDLKRSASMMWMWIMAVLGWVIGAFMMSRIASAVSEMDIPGMLQEESMNGENFDSQMMEDFNGEGDFNTDQLLEEYGQDMTEEEKELFRQMIESTDETRLQDQEAAQEEAI